MTAASPSSFATRAPSSVADMTRMRRSWRNAPCISSASASPRSASSERSWNSSNKIAPTLSKAGSSRIIRVKTPSVTTSIRVPAETSDCILTRKPTVWPTFSPRLAAIRPAAARAARRRGSSSTILRCCKNISSIRARGTRVVLPAPGGATRTARLFAARTARSGSNISSIGRGAGCGLIPAVHGANRRAGQGAEVEGRLFAQKALFPRRGRSCIGRRLRKGPGPRRTDPLERSIMQDALGGVVAPAANGHEGVHGAHQSPGAFALLALGSVGVVFGDIGTSPLYALGASLALAKRHGLPPEDVIGVVSLIIWALFVTVSAKYVLFLMRADNRGEGGTLSLMALAQSALGRRTTLIFFLGVAGSALFCGDAIITPAISVLSALEGLKQVSPG